MITEASHMNLGVLSIKERIESRSNFSNANVETRISFTIMFDKRCVIAKRKLLYRHAQPLLRIIEEMNFFSPMESKLSGVGIILLLCKGKYYMCKNLCMYRDCFHTGLSEIHVF